jgi:hypothetical protein
MEFLLSDGKQTVVEWKELRQQILLQQQQEQEEDEFRRIEKMIIKGFSNLNGDNKKNKKKNESVVSNPNPNPNSTTSSNNMNRVTLNVSNVLLSAICSGIMSYILLSSNSSNRGGGGDSFIVIFSIITGFMVLLVELYFVLKYIS